MVSYNTNLIIQFVLLFIYIVQFITDLILLVDNDIVSNFISIKIFVIINLVFDILVFLYLIYRIMDYTKIKKYKYREDSITETDYWFFVIGTLMYFLGIGFFYSTNYNTTENRSICMNDQIFRIYLFSHLPIAVICFTITVLFFTFMALFCVCMCIKCWCLDPCNTNKITPYY